MTKLTCEHKLLYCGLSNMSSVWAFSDAMILALVFPNMIGLFILFPKVKEELAKYVAAINGKN